MSSKVFIADSSAIISLAYSLDSNHKEALSFIKSLGSKKGIIVIPVDVISESMNIVGKKLGHHDASILYQVINDEKTFVVAEISKELLDAAFKKFQKLPESVSFTDCIVMALADQFETKYIFGFDEVFGKNGYRLPGA